MDLKAYLRYERVFIDSPYDQNNLAPMSKIELGRKSAVFDNFYYVRNEKIFCHICGGKRHFKGITGILEGGDRILFGRSCATEYFGKDVVRLHGAELRRRTKDAEARYKIRTLQGGVSEIDAWLKSYRPLVDRCSQSWIEISHRYPQAFSQIMDHLSKNAGRFVEENVEELATSRGTVEYFRRQTILAAVNQPNAIPFLTKISQRLALVDAFTSALSSLKHQPDQQTMQNLNRQFTKLLQAAETIDAALAFSKSFFSPSNLEAFNRWMESRRRERLAGKPPSKERNLAKKFQAIMGHGFPTPEKTLKDTILQIDAMRSLAEEGRLTVKLA